MGFISMQEDVQESRDDYQRKLDRQKMAPLTDNQQATPQLLDDPEVQWAEKALALQAQLDRVTIKSNRSKKKLKV